MKANERIRVVPVPAGAVSAIDHHDLGVGVGDQGIGERHAAAPAPITT